MNLNIIHEDKQIIVVVKPPKVPSQSDKTGDTDMMAILKEHLLNEYPMAKEPYLGLLHRLDRPVGGLMVFAKTKESNRYLSEEIRNKKFKKEYLAVVCGKPEMHHGELRNYLKKVTSLNMSKVVTEQSKSGKEAVLEYQLLDSVETDEYGILSLLKINLKTGRHHQIRVQFSNANLPLWGDNKYNKDFVKSKGWTQIALWAESLEFKHPKTKKELQFQVNPSDEYPFNLFYKTN